jgi:DNA-binding transcriptional LysR family regulator
MRDTDFNDLDGHILRCFLAILEESSVSRAADRLGVTQSAVSHTLAKLRSILGDPLFVRSGQGLTPTETAISLKEPVQKVLDGMKGLTDQRPFEPRAEAMHFVIGANDMQRELVFPQLMREARAEGIRLSLEFMPSGVPSIAMLRDARCQMMLTPLPPDGSDILQRKLFSGKMTCFFDSSVAPAPESWAEYLRREHLAVRFSSGQTSMEVLRGIDQTRLPRPVVTVSNFNAIAPFIKDSPLITTEIAQMALGPLKDLDAAPLPFETEEVSVFMVWHERSQNDPAHVWLRRQVERIAAGIGPRMAELQN